MIRLTDREDILNVDVVRQALQRNHSSNETSDHISSTNDDVRENFEDYMNAAVIEAMGEAKSFNPLACPSGKYNFKVVNSP
jgi:hypothetical protein